MTGMVRNRLEIIKPYVRSGCVLDVGCVDARTAREDTASRLARKTHLLFRRLVELNPDTIGIDIDREGIQALQEEGYNVICGDAAEVDFDRRFDTIVAGEVIEHVSNVGLFLANLRRHLAPDGVLIITTPNPYCSRQIGRIWRTGKPKIHADHTAWFDPITLTAALQRAGLAVFDGYWLNNQRRRARWRIWRAMFRRYFSRTLMLLARPKASNPDDSERPSVATEAGSADMGPADRS